MAEKLKKNKIAEKLKKIQNCGKVEEKTKWRLKVLKKKTAEILSEKKVKIFKKYRVNSKKFSFKKREKWLNFGEYPEKKKLGGIEKNRKKLGKRKSPKNLQKRLT